jgi:hypothetical protein
MISLLSILGLISFKKGKGMMIRGKGGVPLASTELYIWKTGILPGSPD